LVARNPGSGDLAVLPSEILNHVLSFIAPKEMLGKEPLSFMLEDMRKTLTPNRSFIEQSASFIWNIVAMPYNMFKDCFADKKEEKKAEEVKLPTELIPPVRSSINYRNDHASQLFHRSNARSTNINHGF
jgi:hypothetical protein